MIPGNHLPGKASKWQTENGEVVGIPRRAELFQDKAVTIRMSTSWTWIGFVIYFDGISNKQYGWIVRNATTAL